MWNYIYIATAIAFLIALSYTDLKNRTAPPELTYSILFLGLGLHAAQSLIQDSLTPVIYSVSAAAGMFLFAYIIYRTGGWAGGDVKLFTGLGAIVPFYGELSALTFPIPYPLFILAASTVSVLPFVLGYGVYKVLKAKSKELKRDILSSLPRSIYSGFVLLASLYLARIIGVNPVFALIIAPLIYISREPGYPLTAFLATLSLLVRGSAAVKDLLVFLSASLLFLTGIETYKSIKKNVLREEKDIEELEEGEIPGEDVWIHEGEAEKREPSIIRFTEPGNLVIDSRKARGLTEQDLKTLEEENVEKIKVKKSLPFIPVLAIGLIILLSLEIFL